MPAPTSLRQFKRLRTQAHNADDFRTLAKWCEQRSETYRKKEAEYEAELRQYYSRSSPLPTPKYPPRDQTLKMLIAHYRKLSTHWSELANYYAEKAHELEGTKPQN